MHFAVAAPLALGLATVAAKTVQESASGMFSLLSEKQPTTGESTNKPSGLSDLFAGVGQLGLGEAETSLKGSLSRLEDLIRTHFFKADTPLPDRFQLRLEADGTVRSTGAGELDAEIEALLASDPEGAKTLGQISAELLQLAQAKQQGEYARRYNADPQAAQQWLQEQTGSPSSRQPVDLHFSSGEPPIYRTAEK